VNHFGRKVHYKDWNFDSVKERDFFIRFIENSGKRYEIHRSYKVVTKFPLGGYNKHGITYTPDFVVYGADGSIQHVYDVKSGVNQRAVDAATKIRFTLFELKTGIPVEVVVPRKHDFKMKLYGFTTNFQEAHTRKKRNGKVVTDYYNVYKSIDYDVHDLIGF